MGELSTGREVERWISEARFFDRAAAAARERLRPIDPRVLARYRAHRRTHHNKEFRFHVMGDLRGRTILDIGCGDGGNAVLMATLGGRVTGIDVSPESVAVARERAEINGVSDRVSFVCAPLETADFGRPRFDIIWGDAILHHVIPQLAVVLERVLLAVRPLGQVIFAEPVNRAPWLRRLRGRVSAIPMHGTADERPLEEAELQLIRAHFPALHERYFHLFGRLNRLVLPGHRFEEASMPRRAIVDGLARFDEALMCAAPLARRLAGTCVLHARVR